MLVYIYIPWSVLTAQTDFSLLYCDIQSKMNKMYIVY